MRYNTLISMLIAIIGVTGSYYAYGKIVGFNCQFYLENHMKTESINGIVPNNPDITIIVNGDTLTTVNIPSNQLHRPQIFEKKLKLGYSVIEVYSDSMMIYAVQGLNIYNNKKIRIGLFKSMQREHLSISIN